MPTMPQNTQEFFNTLLPNGLTQSADKAREIDAIFCFKISGEGGGEWTVDLLSSPPSCKPGCDERAQCTIQVDNNEFLAMLMDSNQVMQLYFTGKLTVSGDSMLAMKLQNVFELAL